jgi:hypothetical protein
MFEKYERYLVITNNRAHIGFNFTIGYDFTRFKSGIKFPKILYKLLQNLEYFPNEGDRRKSRSCRS